MARIRSATLITLFALFCGPLVGSAVAGSGTDPTVSGGFPPVIGAVLTATPGTAGDPMAWQTCDSSSTPIGTTYLATGSTYTLQPTDAGTDVCAVELDALTGLVVLGVSDPVGPVGSGPTLSAAGTSVTEGQTLTVTQGAWGGAVPTDTWEDCNANGAKCSSVASDATGTSYAAARSDVGSTIEVFESAQGVTEQTAPTGVVNATAPSADGGNPPTVSGDAQVGGTLTASPGYWSNQPTSYSYQWDHCSGGSCTQVATGASYTPTTADVGDTLVVFVTAYIDRGASYGAAGSAYPSYPTNPVLGVSSSPPPNPNPTPPVIPVTNSRTTNTVGRLTATMRWTFRYAPSYTKIAAMAVEGPALGSTISTRCTGKSCPFTIHRLKVRELKRCRAEKTGHCRAPRQVNLAKQFHGHKLAVGTRVTVRISRPRDIGKYYSFVVRRRSAPSVDIDCMAPGSVVPGKKCTGL
jgi:hypothetical protein